MNQNNGTTALKVDDAGGVPENKKWFVAIVNNRSEKKCAKLFQEKGYLVFVPTQKEKHIWQNNTVRTIEKVLIPTVLFIYCTESERIRLFSYSVIKHFMVDYTVKGKDGKHPIAVIPNRQIDIFMEVVAKSKSPINFEQSPCLVGDKVRVTDGELKGIEGKVLYSKNGATFLIIEIALLGSAKLEIPRDYVERLP